ncbi:MAG: substrate-binding domain-containing protein [Candidatus Desulfofervidaceae bacterium]|nr:substrate-binding domain-containing protein [Candidatus Desulfofervidaceae bacterium]MDL1971597.1 substrate-binding domain-containing protein [Candidatus Desulfofervidaceae bacterium]
MGKWPVIPANRSDDIHNLAYLDRADLILFVAGNQFMVMEELLGAFQQSYPEIKHIFYETLPPGLELKQILAGGAVFQDKILPGTPDVYAAVSEEAMHVLEKNELIRKSDYFIYLHNRIVLMVREGNPLGIASVLDLGKDEVRISQPNPELEDIGIHIVNMYREAGGETLVYRIMEEKRAEGTTIFTVVHHRETPLRLRKGTVDVGPVWATEVAEARKKGLKVEMVEPGELLDQRNKVNYFITSLKCAPHPESAQKFLDFIKSKTAQSIYQKYGFIPHFDTN